METTYYVYSIKMRGWVQRSGTYASDLKGARQFSEAEAIAWCKKHLDHNDAPQHLPVPTGVFAAIAGAAS